MRLPCLQLFRGVVLLRLCTPLVVLVSAFVAQGCGGAGNTPLAPSTPNLQVSCLPSSLSNLGCGSATCTVTATGGFSGQG